MKRIWLVFVSILVLSTSFFGCGSLRNGCNDLQRDLFLADYHLTLYANDGTIIKEYIIRNTHVDIAENGSGIRFLDHSKSVMVNGTYILEQE